MQDDKVVQLGMPAKDVLTEVLKTGAQQLLAQAIEAEVQELLASHADLRIEDGKQAVVRNGYLPERKVQTGLGGIEVKVPKVRDRSGQGIKFTSNLIPPYLKRASSIESLLPWLYLKGVSTGDFQDALKDLLGEKAPGLSAGTISRLKSQWEDDYDSWRKRRLDNKRYVYVWADGVYCNVRQDDKLCLLVLMGSDSTGRKEIIGLLDGYRESEASWHELLQRLSDQGLSVAPELAVGDGALGFWKALKKHWPQTKQQRCWVHKTANVLNKLPKAMQPKVKASLQDIQMADTRDNAYRAFDTCIKSYESKYPGSMQCLKKDKEMLLAFYDFPAEHWQHIRTTNPIESVFATVRLRTHKTKNCGSRRTTLAMAFQLMKSAEKRWHRLRGYKLIADVIQGVKFKDGLKIDQQDAA